MQIDLRHYDLHEALSFAEDALGVRIVSTPAAFGWSGKSAGFTTEVGTWIRLTYREIDKINERVWTGEESASVIRNVKKPDLLRSLRWRDPICGVVWRVDELTLISASAISETPHLAESTTLLGAEWWVDLRSSLTALAKHSTDRVAVRQDLISRRIRQLSGDAVDPTVTVWTTAHADLHWANITGPDLQILDWEGWGRGPLGLDAATLWAYSVGQPTLADAVVQEFREDLSTRDGKLSQLFMCAELLTMIDRFADHPHLEEPLRNAAKDLAVELGHGV